MDQFLEEQPKGEESDARFTTVDLHKYLLGKEKPPELLPRRVDLSFYTKRMNEMYDTQVQIGTKVDYSVFPEERLESPTVSERSCTSFYEPEAQKIQFSPITHGEEESVQSDSDTLVKQGKIPLVEMHTHPREEFFSPIDFARLLEDTPDREGRVAVLVLCPTIQVLALASSETKKYDMDALLRKIRVWDIIRGQNGIQNLIDKMEKSRVINARKTRVDERLTQLLNAGKITIEQWLEKTHSIGSKVNKQVDDVMHDPVNEGIDRQEHNQDLLTFAYENKVKLYASTNRKDFTEFSA